MKKAILSMIIVASGLLSGCSSEESVSRPETIGQTGTLTFSFPAPRRSVTYAEDDSDPLVATENEAAINDVTVYLFQSSGELLLVARKSASPNEVDARSVTFDVNNFTSTGSGYTFYAVANVSGNITDNFVVGSTTLNDFTTAVASDTGDEPIQGGNMLMVGYTTIPDLSAIIESAYTITLRHRVARFDINNVTEDDDQTNNNDQTSDETFFEITKIHVTNTFSSGYLTEESNDQIRPDLAKVSLRGGAAIDVSDVTGINEGLAKSAFYLWPGSLDKKENLNDESTLIEVEGVYTGDGKPVVYKVLLADDQPIDANKRYILKVSRIDRTNLAFELEVSDWDDGETITAVPSVDAVEYTDFRLNSTALPDGEDIDIDLSDNTGDSELRFSTLSENRATDELTATLVWTLGTDYAKNNFTPVVEGDPVVTYGGAKVRQTYKIILPKTTYPVAGTLTIEDVATTKKQTFNITSIPKYENTGFTPVLVGGKYWAPVNVGANSIIYNSALAGCGYYFQWGRSYTMFSDYDGSNPDVGDKVAGPLSDEEAKAKADKFITGSDWLSPPNDYLWTTVDSRGPCPAGWKVPAETELSVLKDRYINTNFNKEDDKRLTIPADEGEYLYLPAAGSRNSAGTWNDRGTLGYYWSSSVANSSARRLSFSSSGSSVAAYNRANGFSVRCIQE
ncbi:MAG: FimB/Mfa2 family fimbrial subunit [Prevotella sp.]|jgi:uncharacterized protein (TIGR02145 family)|nr:FimB/Mfa2 family fimbrial subunit [Prevotella sp.]